MTEDRSGPTPLENSLFFVDIQAVRWRYSQPWTHGSSQSIKVTTHYVGALLLDFWKAFDTVPHQLLLAELQAVGCSINTITRFWNYLTDPEQRVITYEQVTEWMVVSRSFPQGSSLSPLLLNIFTRRLPRQCISST